MSFWKKLGELFTPKCDGCNRPLDYSRRTNLMFMAETKVNSPYQCRTCKAVYCETCAENVPCKKCGGKVFDLAIR